MTTREKCSCRCTSSLPQVLAALRVTAGNIRSLGPAGALGESYRVWLDVVEAALKQGETQGE
jgi:hypothetical protein